MAGDEPEDDGQKRSTKEEREANVAAEAQRLQRKQYVLEVR